MSIDHFVSGNTLNIVRVGNSMTYGSMKEIGKYLMEPFLGLIECVDYIHHASPVVDEIDTKLLTMVLDEDIGGHVLGITNAELLKPSDDKDEFYTNLIGGKNSINDVAVISTKRLSPKTISTREEYKLLISRAVKVSLHEVGHNFGLTDHGRFMMINSEQICPMSKGENNRFGTKGYVEIVIDGRGFNFCEECNRYLKEYKTKRDNYSKQVQL